MINANLKIKQLIELKIPFELIYLNFIEISNKTFLEEKLEKIIRMVLKFIKAELYKVKSKAYKNK